MIELAVAVAAGTALIGLLVWYDRRGTSEWEDLLSPEAREAHELLQRKFAAEESAVDWTCSRAAAAGTSFLIGLVPDRLQLLSRLELYARIVAAAAPPPRRLHIKLLTLRHGFAAIAKSGDADPKLVDARTALIELDKQTLESCRLLASAVAAMERVR